MTRSSSVIIQGGVVSGVTAHTTSQTRTGESSGARKLPRHHRDQTNHLAVTRLSNSYYIRLHSDYPRFPSHHNDILPGAACVYSQSAPTVGASPSPWQAFAPLHR